MRERIGYYLAGLRRRRILSRLLIIMSCVVVFITTYMLVLPAITTSKTAACGIEEHRHDAGCYLEVPVCGLQKADGHTHTDECYEKILLCEKEVHSHSAECYKKRQ